MKDEVDSRSPESQKSKIKKRAIIFGIILPAFVLAYLLIPHHRPIEFPPSILQLRLTEELRGKQAQEILDEMHRKSLAPDESAIGVYFCTDGSAKLYISRYNSPANAEQQIEAMAHRIQTGDGVFTDYREFLEQNKKIYSCNGLGQKHYFFLFDNTIYWWSVDVQLAQSTLKELIRFVDLKKQP